MANKPAANNFKDILRPTIHPVKISRSIDKTTRNSNIPTYQSEIDPPLRQYKRPVILPIFHGKRWKKFAVLFGISAIELKIAWISFQEEQFSLSIGTSRSVFAVHYTNEMLCHNIFQIKVFNPSPTFHTHSLSQICARNSKAAGADLPRPTLKNDNLRKTRHETHDSQNSLCLTEHRDNIPHLSSFAYAKPQLALNLRKWTRQ